ncbi:MAG: FAD:protein FMN transferase [Alicyclobacillus sp.]|nr:FAD:protein FMN transferase [Alicyclobacillus sp.]
MRTWRRIELKMGTRVEIRVVTDAGAQVAADAIRRAFAEISRVEAVCSRFDPSSELSQLLGRVGTPVPVSEILYQTLAFAREVAEHTQGRFDPTVGADLLRLGFDRHYLTGERTPVRANRFDPVTYRDFTLDPLEHTVTLHKPMVLDLGAVAKGLAVDLAAAALREFPGFVVDAGGDLFAAGLDERGAVWRIGIQHPNRPAEVICWFEQTELAVCTSGSYERRSPLAPGKHHIVSPGRDESPDDWVSVTAVGPSAMLADAFSTAAFVCGRPEGLQLLEDVGLEGLCITDAAELQATPGLSERLHIVL